MSAATRVLTQLVPEPGQLVHVRDRRWVVGDVLASGRAPDVLAAVPKLPQHVVHLVSVDDDGFGDTLDVVWGLEPGRRLVDLTALPEPPAGRFDPPARLDALLDVVRWGAIASDDARALKAPLRAPSVYQDPNPDRQVSTVPWRSCPRTRTFGRTPDLEFIPRGHWNP